MSWFFLQETCVAPIDARRIVEYVKLRTIRTKPIAGAVAVIDLLVLAAWFDVWNKKINKDNKKREAQREIGRRNKPTCEE